MKVRTRGAVLAVRENIPAAARSARWAGSTRCSAPARMSSPTSQIDLTTMPAPCSAKACAAWPSLVISAGHAHGHLFLAVKAPFGAALLADQDAAVLRQFRRMARVPYCAR
jgi:hypothetical protein